MLDFFDENKKNKLVYKNKNTKDNIRKIKIEKEIKDVLS